MSFISWSMVLICNYLAIYALNSLKLGMLILMLSFSISMVMSLSFLSWLSLMFFIIYMGGLLVLFFYLSSLKYKPLFSGVGKHKKLKSLITKTKMLMILILCMTFYKFNGKSIKFGDKNMNKYSYNLFKKEEANMIMMLGVVLLLVLWLVTKLTCKTRGALRPTFQE